MTAPPVSAGPVGAGNVGIYNGLSYTGFGVRKADPITKTHEGIVPQSQPNIALAIGLPVSVMNPTSTLSPVHSIATNYTKSPYKTFDLPSFYFACNQETLESAAGAAIGCVISVIGFYPGGSQTPVYTAGSAAPNPLKDPMVLAAPNFKGVNYVIFGVAASATTSTVTNIGIDNLVHVNHPWG